MKVKANEMVYLEHFDIKNFITVEESECPHSVREELFKMGGANKIGVKGQFAYAFKQPENVKWFMSRKYILDYSKYLRYSIPRLEEILKRAERKYEARLQRYNQRSWLYRSSHSGQKKRQRLTREHWYIMSLQYLIYCQRNNILICFAKDIKEA